MRSLSRGESWFKLVFFAFWAGSCSPQAPAEEPPTEAKPFASAGDEEAEASAEGPAAPSGRLWATETFSPRPGSVPDPDLEELSDACGRGDAALHDVAAFVAQYQASHGDPPSLDEVNFELKRRGSPYVMPRMWTATTSGVPKAELLGAVQTWAKSRPARGQVRCGAASFDGAKERQLALLQVDVLAELAPLPTRVEAGVWLELEVGFLAPTTAASVVLLPPDGPPRTVNSTLEGTRARARLSLATEGTWLIQVMATQEGGPLPIASALVTAGKQPPDAYDARPVPGEKAFDASLNPGDALFVLVNAARKEEGLPALKRNKTLDRAATMHSTHMREQGRISHDTGHGDPAKRVAQAGITPKATGENVALAQSVQRLHRALWASPSHRENLLLRRWDEVGIGIVERADGALLATELFIDSN